ncbi:MAG: phospholipid carrier-dependent glycosyltransferase, partial [Cyanobacteria bacterium P01_G01_bin.19]
DRPLVEVTASTDNSLSLTVEVPAASPPGVPVPVTYKWAGDRRLLESGMVLLTWENENDPISFWIHDRRIGMGAIDFQSDMAQGLLAKSSPAQPGFEVIERTATFPPADLQPGKYLLKATYLNPITEETKPIDISSAIAIDPQAAATPAPELDLATQLRRTAPKMAESIQGLEPVFAQTARINQYDAKQDYLQQVESTLSYRLRNQQVSQQKQSDWLYAIALSRVLQQDVNGAIESFSQITELEPANPYGYAYLGFVHLYDWQPKLADAALDSATAINPNIPEVKTLQRAAAAMQGKLIKAWQLFQSS